MRQRDVLALFDFTYWGNRQLLDVAARLTPHQWTAPSDITTRDLRATLVHTLDVEWSWRVRLQKRPDAEWGPDVELQPMNYPDVATLAAHWEGDERDMRAWLGTLDDAALAAGWSDATPQAGKAAVADFPLWYYLIHIVTHSQQQRSDAAILLTHAGHSPGNIEFLDYADTTRPKGR